MPNGRQMMDDLQFEEMIKTFDPAEQFLARQIMEVKRECKRRLDCPVVAPLTAQLSRRQLFAGGGLIALLTALFTVLANFLEKII